MRKPERTEKSVLGVDYMDPKLVPGGGVEPPRPEGRRILSPLRLPVPPSRHFVEVLDFSTYFTFFVFFILDNDCETVQVNVEVFIDFHRSLRRP